MDVERRQELIDELCSFEARLAGTDAERRAANRLAAGLRDLGRRVDVEPIHVHRQTPLVWALHCVLGVAASLAATAIPVIAFGVVLFTAAALYLDLNARLYLLRRLFFRRVSQNVVSPGGRRDAQGVVILTAHVDVARTGALHGPRARRALAAIDRLARFPITPTRLMFWSLASLVPLLALRAAGVESTALSAVQLLPTLVLVVAIFALIDIQLSATVPGANDDASGVATAVSLADELGGDRLDHLDLWVVLTGGGECGAQGMRQFIRSRRKRLDRTATYVLNLEAVGRGEVRFEIGEGPALTYDLGSRLTELCAAVAEADREGDNSFGAAPHRNGYVTDALPARLARIPATTLTCLEAGATAPAHQHEQSDTPEAIDPAALERAHDFALELIRTLDRDVGRRAGVSDPGPAKTAA